jgi:hypothetical protein
MHEGVSIHRGDRLFSTPFQQQLLFIFRLACILQGLMAYLERVRTYVR